MMPNTTGAVAFALAIAFAGAASAQEPDVPPDAVISQQRTSCYGPCPICTVTIDASGAVTYEGERFVRVVGRRTAQIDPSSVATLLAPAEQIRFFGLRNAYRVIENPDGTHVDSDRLTDDDRDDRNQGPHEARRRLCGRTRFVD